MPYNYSLTINPDSNPKHLYVGGSTIIKVDMDEVEEAGQPVNLSVSGLPSGVTASFPDLVAGRQCCTATSTFIPTPVSLLLVANSSVTPGNYTITVTGLSNSVTRDDTYEITVLAAPTHPLPYTPIGTAPVIPLLSTYESNFYTYGPTHCAEIANTGLTFDQRLGATYYDSERVWYQAAAYFNDDDLLDCSQEAEAVYRDGYVIPAGGGVPGFWNFPRGMRLDYERTGDTTSKSTVLLLSENAAYAGPLTLNTATIPAELSREVSYAIESFIDAEKVGYSRNARLEEYVNILLGHFDQWFLSMSYRSPNSSVSPADAVGKYYIQPFMVGIGMEALIQYYEEIYQDPRIPTIIKIACDFLFAHAYDSTYKAFWYENWIADPANIPAGHWTTLGSSPTADADDLNMLIAPAFAWLYRKTGNSAYQTQGDLLFEGAVTGAFLSGSKQFNQSYRWGFHYVDWRTFSDGGVILLGACLSE